MSGRKQKLIRLGAVFFLSVVTRWAVLAAGWIAAGLGADYDLLSFLAGAGDAPHYLQIAQYGYLSSGDTVNNIVFYPLYPLLIRAFSCLTGEYVIAAVLVSNLFLGLAGCALYTLFGELSGDPGGKKAADGLAFFLCYPFAMFLTGIYTESLSLFLSAAALLCICRRRWGGVAAFGFLAAVSRAQGIVLLVPAMWEWLLDVTGRRRRASLKAVPCMLCIPLGFGAFLLLNRVVTGDAFAFVGYEAAAPWYNTSHWIASNLTQHYNMGLQYSYLGMIIYWVQLVLYFLAVIGLAAGVMRRERSSFMAYGGAYVCVSYLHGWLISGPRYMLGCLPLFLLAASIRRDAVRYAVLGISLLLSVGYMSVYLQGGAIM